MRTRATPRGCMLTFTASKAIGAMRSIGTDRPKNRPRAVRSTKSGMRSLPHCWRRERPTSSAWFHAMLPDHGGGRGRSDEFDEGLRRICLLGVSMQSGREHGDALNVRRQWPDDVDALDRQKLADLMEAEFSVAARNQFAHCFAGGNLLHLRLDLVCNSHPLNQLCDIDTARTGRIGDRFCRQHRLLERVK